RLKILLPFREKRTMIGLKRIRNVTIVCRELDSSAWSATFSPVSLRSSDFAGSWGLPAINCCAGVYENFNLGRGVPHCRSHTLRYQLLQAAILGRAAPEALS